MLKYIQATIRLSEMHTQNISVPAWEFPVVQAVHGNGVKETGTVTVDRPVPAASDEFQRLANKYRAPAGSPDTPYVAQVYGAFGPGLANLQKEIDRAAEAPKAKRGRKPAETKIDETDPLVA